MQKLVVEIRERVELTPRKKFRAWVDLVAADEELKSRISIGEYDTKKEALEEAQRVAGEVRRAYRKSLPPGEPSADGGTEFPAAAITRKPECPSPCS